MFDQETPRKEKVIARKIELRTRSTYQVGKKIYKSAYAAAKAEAWAMICKRYGRLSEIKEFQGMECDCYQVERDYGNDYIIRLCCPIHSRADGYFSRLHKRLMRLILKGLDKT